MLQRYSIKKVVANHDYEPYALKRDQEITSLLEKNGIAFETHKDQVIFEKNEVVKDDGNPYKVFTPYSRKWLTRFREEGIAHFASEDHLNAFAQIEQPQNSLEELGFSPSSVDQPRYINEKVIREYEDTRNYPALNATSRIGAHLRFGTLSAQNDAKAAAESNPTFLKELILSFLCKFFGTFHIPTKRVSNRNMNGLNGAIMKMIFNVGEGKTGYPFVDAGMRELNATGFMHNRVRMLVGSFLCKHLLIDWR